MYKSFLIIIVLISQVVISLAPVVYLMKFLYDIFYMNNPFWISVLANFLYVVIVECIAIVIFLISISAAEYECNK